MPNWVYNEMRFKSENDCKRVAELIKSKDSDFDFNNIIPMPPYLINIPVLAPRNTFAPSPTHFPKVKR